MAGVVAAVETVVTFDEAWPLLQDGINKLIDQVEGVHNQAFTSEEYMRYYTLVYNVCHPNQIGPETKKMYDQYRKTFQDYISAKVLPSLRGKENEELLQELLRRWKNHKIITRWLSRFFHYLDRYYITKMQLPSTVEASRLAFYELVYGELNDQIRDAIILLIDMERDGEQIDQAMVKEVIDIYVELANGAQKYYAKDFEEAMVNATAEFYSRKSSEWITNWSYDDYMLKVEECLNDEKNKVCKYLKFRSANRIVETAHHELLNVHAIKLEEKKSNVANI